MKITGKYWWIFAVLGAAIAWVLYSAFKSGGWVYCAANQENVKPVATPAGAVATGCACCELIS